MKIFGDDGFRDKYNHGLMSKNFLNNFFDSLNFFLNKNKIKSVYIGYDTRFSAKPIINIILSKLKNLKYIFVIDRPITTPYLNYLSKEKKSFCIMITASHFNWNYNGFKFFNNGNKLSKKKENEILSYFSNKHKLVKKKVSIKKIFPKNYINYINKKLKKLNKNKIIFDLANGGACSFKKNLNIFRKSKLINHTYDGKNINKNSGSNFIKKTLKKKLNFDYLFSFDGDGDRVVIAKKNYGVIESEKLALIFAKFLSISKKKDLSIVGTEITNPWFLENLKKLNINFIRSKVGDRNVIEKQIFYNSNFGFETSGHFSFENSMDGILTSVLFLNIIQKKPIIISNILNKKINYNQIIIKTKSKEDGNFLKRIKKFKNIKIVKRKSIWEKLYKIYIFYKIESNGKIKYFFENKYQKVIKNKFH